MERSSGILMPVSSLPSSHGIGTFGKAAYDFVDFLKESGQKCWQVLPLGPTGYGDSPYQSFSTFAGNPYFIDLDLLAEEGLVSADMLQSLDWGEDPTRVHYLKIYQNRFAVLKAAFLSSPWRDNGGLQLFIDRNQDWVQEYALFMSLKQHFGMLPWTKWPNRRIRSRETESLNWCRLKLQKEIDFWIYVQYLFFKQWEDLKHYINKAGIRVIGDLPIYVAMDSVDVWSHPDLFMLDEDGMPLAVAGCPPDYFSRDGQLWGNPICRWDQHRETGYDWWRSRLSASLRQFDLLRIDHFRGFEAYYKIPSGHLTARKGTWEKGPGLELFQVLNETLGEDRIIAEDLGFMTAEVKKLLRETGFPGMKVLQFAFDEKEHSDYLPHKYRQNCVVYTGTHDNTTAMGWFSEATPGERAFASRYLALNETEGLNWGFIRGAFGSVANLAIAQMQDFLGLPGSARMNTPSTISGNWQWRLTADRLTPALSSKIRALTEMYDR